MPSRRVLAPAGGLVALLALSSVAVAQGPSPGAELDIGMRVGIRFVVSFVVSVVLGGGLIAFGPRYANGIVSDLHEDPITAFGWGLLVGIGVPIALFLIALTIIGLLVTIPGLIVLFVLGVVGNAVTVVWIGDLLSGADVELNGRTVLIGALTLAVLAAVPVLGDFVVAVLEFVGLGAVSRRLYGSWRGDERSPPRSGGR